MTSSRPWLTDTRRVSAGVLGRRRGFDQSSHLAASSTRRVGDHRCIEHSTQLALSSQQP